MNAATVTPWPPPASVAPLALQRHTLVWLDPRGWQGVLARPGADLQARACLGHWAENDLPLVVTRQPAGTVESWQLGLSAPLRWSRQRLWLSVALERIARTGSFPTAAAIEAQLPETWHERWRVLCAELSATGTDARVYGSHGWQALSGLAHVGPASDIDLLLRVDGAEQADTVTAVLERAASDGPRLDGELVFNGSAAVAWREWLGWRRRGRGTILVKRLRSESLESGLESLA